MSKQQLKTIRPHQYDEPRRKKAKPIVVPSERKILRPPAVYSNRSWEDTINHYENYKIENHVSSKFPRGKRN